MKSPYLSSLARWLGTPLFFVAILLAGSTSLDAQSTCGIDLRDSFKSEYYFRSDAEIYENLNLLFTTSEHELNTLAERQKKGEKLEGAYESITALWSRNREKESFRKKFVEAKTRYQLGVAINNKFFDEIYESTVSEEALKAYVECRRIEMEAVLAREGLKPGPGGIFKRIVGDTEGVFTFILNKQPAQGTADSITVSSVRMINIEPIGDSALRAGAICKNYTGLSQTMRIVDPRQKASLTVNIDNFDPVVHEFAVSPYDRFPIGSILASTLDFNAFSAETQNVLPFDLTKSKWAPADGRNVALSEYKRYNDFVPDLRGQFLRGFNQFYSSGEPQDIVNGGDSGPRSLQQKYSYQSDGVGEHTHPYTDTYRYGNVSKSPGRHNEVPRDGTTETKMTSINKDAAKETRPRNIAVFYYIRINN